MKSTFLSRAALITGLATTPVASSANIVLNPGFESGFTSWTVGGIWFSVAGAYAINGPHSGSLFVETPCAGAACISTPTAFFYQDLPTIIGQTYTLSFWYDLGACQIGCGPEELKVLWDSTVAFDLATTTSGFSDPGWLMATVNNLQANSTLTRLEFIGRQDPGALGVDDVDVHATPEPSTLALLGGALAAIVGIGRWRKNVAARLSTQV